MKILNINPYKASTVQKAIDELKALRKLYQDAPQKLLEAYTTRFGEILSEQAPPEAQGMWTYETQYNDNRVVGVFTFKGEVEFIEFGTGIVGSEHHEGINMEWTDKLPPPYTGYESGHMIDPVTHTWKYWKDGHWIITKGQEANPFLYRSVQQLQEESTDIARKVLYGQG